MTYERAAKRDAKACWCYVNDRYTKQQAAASARRFMERMLREEDADTSVPLWDDPDFLAFQEAA